MVASILLLVSEYVAGTSYKAVKLLQQKYQGADTDIFQQIAASRKGRIVLASPQDLSQPRPHVSRSSRNVRFPTLYLRGCRLLQQQFNY